MTCGIIVSCTIFTNQVIYEDVVQVLSPIVSDCVLNQSHEHWLLLDALQFIISTYCGI
jgi:hypothetical protein